jgi:hypothetical protein
MEFPSCMSTFMFSGFVSYVVHIHGDSVLDVNTSDMFVALGRFTVHLQMGNQSLDHVQYFRSCSAFRDV